jgi:DUF4097 and DUF4098 domain-containing protein YvlB
MKREAFAASGPLRLRIRVPSGSVEIETTDALEAAATVEPLNEPARKAMDDVRVELAGDELVVDLDERRRFGFFARTPAFRVTVRAPQESSLEVSTVSADVRAQGRFGAAELKTVSGDVAVDEVAVDATVKSVSGGVQLGRVGGQATVNSVSGDVNVGEATCGAEIKTVSGDQAVDSVTEGSTALQSVSGDIRVGIRRGSGVWMDAKSTSGKTVSELDPSDGPPDGGPLVELRAKAVSGDIRIVRAG